MYEATSLLNTLMGVVGFVMLTKSYELMNKIFATAKKEKVEEILHYRREKFRIISLVKLGARLVTCFVVVMMDTGRLIAGSPFLGTNDMYAWIALNVAVLIMGSIEYWSTLVSSK